MYFRKENIYKMPLKVGANSLLGSLDVELTERCNNNCIHCYINRPIGDINSKNRELSAFQVKELLKEAVSLGCFSVRFTGGEPLLRNDFEDIYVSARKMGLKVLIFTNACLITERLAELFARIPPLEEIEVTVYGMKKSSYEAVTGTPGSFEKAWKGIKLLIMKKVPFVVKAPMLPPFKPEIEEFERWVHENISKEGYGNYAISFDLRARRDSEEKNTRIRKLRLSPQESLEILARDRAKYVECMRDFCANFTDVPGRDLFSCGAGLKGGCVDAYGNFQMCLLLRHPDTVYSLAKGSLKDALVNFFPKIRKMEATDTEYLKRCARCFLKAICEQCPAKSWMEHGLLDRPVEYLCEVAHEKARFLGMLDKGEKAWEVNGKERVEKFLAKDEKQH